MACGLTPELARMLSQMGEERERSAADAARELEEAAQARQRQEQQQQRQAEAASGPGTANGYDWTRAYGRWEAWEDPEELARREHEARERSERKRRQAAMGGCDHDHSAEQRLMDMTTAEKQAACDEFRRLGNAFFAQGQHARAAFHYHRALVYFEYMFPDSEREAAAVDALRLRVLLNMAACKLRTQQLDDAVHNADQALEIDPRSAKALFRRAQARRMRDEFALAEQDLDRALELADSGACGAIRQEKALLRAKMLAYKLRSRDVSAAMFGAKPAPSRAALPGGSRQSDAQAMELMLAPQGSDEDGELQFESGRPWTSGLAELDALVGFT